MFSSHEIQDRIRLSYIERLEVRLKRMRKQLMDRDWNGLRIEATHLAEGAHNFGYPNLAAEVAKTLVILNTRKLTRTAIDSDAKNALESLFQKLDRFLVDQPLP